MKKEEKTKQERLEEVYHLHARDVYKVCFHYAGDRKKAQQMMLQVFKDFYRHIDEVAPDYALGYMAGRAKALAQGDIMSELAAEQQEVTV